MTRPSAVAAAVLTVVLAAAGCGVRPTGITDSGIKPRVGGQADEITVYLVKDGRLSPVTRPGLPGHPFLAIEQLSVRPTEWERKQGLRTAVPGLIQGTRGPTRADAQGNVTQYLLILRPEPTPPFSRLALGQIACTAAAIPGFDGAAIGKGTGVGRERYGCDRFADLLA